MTRFCPTFRNPALCLALAATIAGLSQSAAAQEKAYAVAPIAVTGEPAPGTDGLLFGSFYFGDLNDSGLVSFAGQMNTNVFDAGVWAGSPSNTSLFFRVGEPAPGAAALTFAQIWGGGLVNAAGQMAVTASCSDGDMLSPCTGIWVGPAGNLDLLALSGEPAPGTAGFNFSPYEFWITSIDDFGVTTFYATTDSPDGNNGSGAWRGTPGSLEVLVQAGDPAPGTSGFSFARVWGPVASHADGMLFYGVTDNPDFDLSMGIWLVGPSDTSLVAIAGQEAPGAGGRNFREFSVGNPALTGTINDTPASGLARNIDVALFNGAGEIAFTAYVDSVDPANPLNSFGDNGIWIKDAIGIRLVAMTGDPAPGTTASQFRYVNHPNFNASGLVAFDGALIGADSSNDHGIWRGLPDHLSLLVREGDPAPGTAGETFGSLVLGPSMNDTGEIIFHAQLAESGTFGIWSISPSGEIALVLRDGEILKVNDGDYREIHWIAYQDGIDSSLSMLNQFNEAGQLAFWVYFTDGTSGLFRASPIDTTTNQPPIANAGPDQTMPDGLIVTIDGSGSSDPEETILSFVWSIDGVEIGAGSRVMAEPLPVGSHTIILTVTDRGGASASDSMVLTIDPNLNLAPVANAGLDQTVNHVQTVTLDGSGSFDPEGDVLTYVWMLNGAQIATGPQVTVGPFDASTTHVFTLTITDSLGASASDDVILSVAANLPPVADAGPDQTVNHAQTITLDGTGSSDPEGVLLTYVWTLNGAQIATGPQAEVGPFDVGTYIFTLTVTDDLGVSTSSEMILTVINAPPITIGWASGLILTMETTQLNGTHSSDPEGGPLDYVWSISGLQIGTGPTPIVGPFDAGVYTITLTVTDDHGASASDEMEMTVLNRTPAADSGPDQTVNHAETATLDGTASYDPEGGVLTYVWTINSVVIATGPNPIVGPFPVGKYAISLTVTDDHGATTTAFPMVLTVVNEPPMAVPGPDQMANYAQTVLLDGTGSFDPEAGVLSYIWTIGGTQIATGPNPEVGPFAIGGHLITLTVTDDHGASASNPMVISVVNEMPAANAGPDRTVAISKGRTTTVTLDGSASSDPEGGALSYHWTEDGRTVGTSAVIQIDVAVGDHTFTLTVTDELGATGSDSVVVTATKGNKTASL